ncbi:Mpp10 protein [Marasmius fiardii PR-910]|nr:Mpp10 protein [Marasmius fiardii PR-910]
MSAIEASQTEDLLIPELSEISLLIDNKPECLGAGDTGLKNAALKAAKYIFDLSVKSEINAKEHLENFLNSIHPSQAPQTRSQTLKRKRSPDPPPSQRKFEPTPLSSLFVDGMADEQVWSQLDLKVKNICGILDHILVSEQLESGDEGLAMSEEEDEEDEEELDEETEAKLTEAITRAGNGENVDFAALGLENALVKYLAKQEGLDDEDDDDDDDEDEDDDEFEREGDENIALRDSSPEELEEDEQPPKTMLDIISQSQRLSEPSKKKGKPKSSAHQELDDGFFDLDAFNAETERTEAKRVSSGRLDDDDESSDEEGSVDLFAPVDDLEAFDEEDLENDASNLFYADFFKPPAKGKRAAPKKPESPKKAGSVRFHDEVRVRAIKATGKSRPTAALYMEEGDGDDDEVGFDMLGSAGLEEDGFGESQGMDAEDDEDFGEFDDEYEDGGLNGQHFDVETSDEESEDEGNLRNIIERLKDDLFAEEPVSHQDLSTHEKRMAALTEQISELEAENVAKKDWALLGEADSRSRPQNSLLEEDLEFERVQKPVPVITEDVVQNLEERIKARIREGHFDDVVRIRPFEDKPFLPSRFFELNDSKSKQSLAQIYEEEYIASQTGGVAGEDRDGKLKKEHAEIEKLWEGICGKLDALCNTHFTPKQPKATISTVSNVSTATLESALPTTQSASTMLAPEEVFAPQASDLRARSELTPAEKQALRRKERKARKKNRDALDKSVDKYAKAKKGGSVKKQKEEALKSVVKSGKGVTVVGKKSKDLTKGKKSKS